MFGDIVFINEQRKIVQRFIAAGAISPALAKSIKQIGIHPSLSVERLIAGKVLRHGEQGTLYVDEEAWVALRRKRMLTISGIVVFLALCYTVYFFVTREF